MQYVDPSSPWWPLYVAQLLGAGHAPGIYEPKYQHWFLWHHAFLRLGAGFIPAPAGTTLNRQEAA